MRLIRGAIVALLLALGVLLWKPWARSPLQPTPASVPERSQVPGDPGAMRERARRLLAERTVRPENLDEAIALLKTCGERLRPSGPSQDARAYVEVREALCDAEKSREQAIKDLWLAYERQRKLGDVTGARAALRLVIRTAGDPADPDHRRAQAALERFP